MIFNTVKASAWYGNNLQYTTIMIITASNFLEKHD